MAVVLSDLLNEKHVVLNLRSRTGTKVLGEIVDVLHANHAVGDPKKFLEELLARERASPTTVEHGVGFPHARTDLVDRIVLGVGRSRRGVTLGTSEERAHLVFVLGVPRQMINDYLVCIGALARLAKDEATRTSLIKAETAGELVEILRAGSLLLE